jgi:hypothetical protein
MAREQVNNSPAAHASPPRIQPSGRQFRLIAFYAGVPLFVACYGALNNWKLLESVGYLGALGFHAAHALIPWWITAAATSLAMWSLKSFKPPAYLLMIIGALVGGLAAMPYSNWVTTIAGAEWQDVNVAARVAPLFTGDFWRAYLTAAALWLVTNFVFDRFLGLPRYRYVIPRGYDFREGAGDGAAHAIGEADAETAAESSVPAPGFVQRIPARIAVSDILGIKAEQHYIRVFTPQREYMVLYRFSDAVRDLDPQLGLQVHRSYWVSKAAIDTVRPSAKKFSLRLNSGASIPVSTPYHGIVKEFARTNQIPLR